MTTPTLTLEDIRAAAARIEGFVDRTPCRRSRQLSDLTGAEVWVKFENLHYTASFKERGALNRLCQLTPDEKKRGVIAASAGNHASALAYHGGLLGVPVTIVMPQGTPFVKIDKTRRFGAEVVIEGLDFTEATNHAFNCATRRASSSSPPSTTSASSPARAPAPWRCWSRRPSSTRSWCRSAAAA